ncbi:MAG TPA: hypothetical protein VGN63_10675 [Flavisolibacter sp.]|nr:hypothetical protein [Flavisolibacter sp.]
MKYCIYVLVFFSLLFQGCDLRKREEVIAQKEARLNEKEQELLLKEKTLQIKEEELVKREQRLDSTRLFDSTAMYNAALPGTWDVKMTCTETSCPGSAVGDTKTEVWDISYVDNNVIAKAMVNNELVRVYSGLFTGNTLELVDNRENIPNQPPTRIVVRLRLANNTLLEGTREIERINECKILYSMTLTKRTPQP